MEDIRVFTLSNQVLMKYKDEINADRTNEQIAKRLFRNFIQGREIRRDGNIVIRQYLYWRMVVDLETWRLYKLYVFKKDNYGLKYKYINERESKALKRLLGIKGRH